MAAPRSPDATGDTRRRIIDTALELFATRGYAGTSMRDISMQLSVTKAALYYHFPSKEDLLDALAQPFVEGLGELGAVAAELSERELLTRYVTLLAGSAGRGLRAVFSDPSAVKGLLARHDIPQLVEAIESGLVARPTSHDRLLARAALGAVHGAVAPPRSPGVDLRRSAELTQDERQLLVLAALSVLHAGERDPHSDDR